MFLLGKQRVRGIEPPCAAWEAAVLPLNYTRDEILILDFRLPIATETKARSQIGCNVRCAQRLLLVIFR